MGIKENPSFRSRNLGSQPRLMIPWTSLPSKENSSTREYVMKMPQSVYLNLSSMILLRKRRRICLPRQFFPNRGRTCRHPSTPTITINSHLMDFSWLILRWSRCKHSSSTSSNSSNRQIFWRASLLLFTQSNLTHPRGTSLVPTRRPL